MCKSDCGILSNTFPSLQVDDHKKILRVDQFDPIKLEPASPPSSKPYLSPSPSPAKPTKTSPGRLFNKTLPTYTKPEQKVVRSEGKPSVQLKSEAKPGVKPITTLMVKKLPKVIKVSF